MTVLQKKPAPSDLMAPAFENVSIILFDLFRASLLAGQPVITQRTFTNCDLEGPAVAAILGDCAFEGTDFGYTGGDTPSLVIRSGSPGKVMGALPFHHCRFVDSRFFGVGFTGPDHFLEQLMKLGPSR